MHITILMVLTYIACCVRIGTAPWKYFQLNARYFSGEQGIFSKMAIDQLIPRRWRLFQEFDGESVLPPSFPVFLKPEWGQNAHGIFRADTSSELVRLRTRLREQPRRYLLQEAAPGSREFEIFSIDTRGTCATPAKLQPGDVVTVTEAVNASEAFPINSKYNHDTRYIDVSKHFSAAELATLAGYLRQIGTFGIARMSVRAHSREALLAGQFHVIEINLFLPMPINLLDDSYTWQQKWRFIRGAMMSLAQATRAVTPVMHPPAVFTRMMIYSQKKRRESVPSRQVSTRRGLL